MQKQIFVRTILEALHEWKDAPEEVYFLRNTHRHLFHIKVTWNVDHNDRDKEFFIMQDKLQSFLNSFYWIQEDGYHHVQSCEQVCEDVLTAFKDAVSCEVSEDGENWAILTRTTND